MDDAAGWRSTIRTDAQYFGSLQGDAPPLTGIPGWTLSSIQYDLLHALHIGTGRDFAGAALADLVRTPKLSFVVLLVVLRLAWFVASPTCVGDNHHYAIAGLVSVSATNAKIKLCCVARCAWLGLVCC